MANKAFQQSAFQNDAFQWESDQHRVTFFADAIIYDPSHPVFTADAYIHAPYFEDDFNRGSLGGDYTNVTSLSIHDSEYLAPDLGTWGEADFTIPRQLNPTTTIQYDFWVPGLPFEGYHGYEIDSAYQNVYAYIDNASSEYGKWAAYFPISPFTHEYPFEVVGNRWYRTRWLLSPTSGDVLKLKVWPRDEAEPVAWQDSLTRTTTVSTQVDHYIYVDSEQWFAIDHSYPQLSKMDNVIITRSGLGTITANALIVEDADDRHATFTADAIFIPWELRAPLDNSAAPYNTLAQNTGAAETFTGVYWQAGPGLTRKTYSYVPDPGLSGEIFARWDFWVPNDPTDGGSYWEHRHTLSYFYIDSWPWESTQWSGQPEDWSGHFEFGTRDNDELFFPVTANTWYTIFASTDNRVGGHLKAWVWEQGTTMPADPTIDVVITNVQSFALSNVPSIQIQGYTGTPEVMRMDNSLMYAWTATPVTTFTGDAVIKKTVAVTFTANAVIDAGAAVVSDDFTADAVLSKTFAPSGSSNVASTATGAAVGVTAATSITVYYNTSGGTLSSPSLAFVSLSIDLIGAAIPTITPSHSRWNQIASTNVGTDHALITWAAWVVHADDDYVTLTWSGARDATGVGWASGMAPETGSYLAYDVYTESDATPSAAIRDVTDSAVTSPSAMTPPRKWSAYAVFAGSTNTTWTLDAPAGFAYISTDQDVTNASIRAARDDFNARTTAYSMFTGDPNTAQPRLSHLIVVYEYGTYFTADAYFQRTNDYTFTADAWFEPIPRYQFTADAVKKKTASATFTANAYLVSTHAATFTANAILKVTAGTGFDLRTFTAKAVLTGKLVPPTQDMPRLAKRMQMSIVQRRPLEFSAFIPPKVPDQEEEQEDQHEPQCLPPCAPFGAGGSMNGWGSFKTSITKCDECNIYFRSDSEFLGSGSAALDSAEHYDYCGAHQRNEHTTRLWVNYPSIPPEEFLLRAKLTWDENGPDQLAVKVYSVANFPSVDMDGGYSAASFDDDWEEGSYVGNFVFINDAVIGGYVILGNSQYKYQDKPSDLVVDGGALGSNIMRFQLQDEDTYLAAKFRAANLSWEI